MKKYIFLSLLSISLFSCKNGTQIKSNSESKSDTNVIGYDTSVLVERNFKPITNKNDVIGVWGCYMAGSKLPYNLTIHEDGTLDYDDRKGNWDIANGLFNFSDNLNNYTGRIDGKYLRLQGVAKLDGRKFETEVIKMNEDEIKKDKIATQSKIRLERINHFRNDYKNTMFQIKQSGMRQGIILNDDGTFNNGEYDYNSNSQYVFISILSKGTWDVVDDNTILLHDFYGSESKSDFKLVLERDRFFGTDILILHGLYPNGNPGNEAMTYQRYLNK